MESSGDGKLGTAATVSSDSVGGPAVVEAASTQKVALPPTEAPLALEENDDSAALQTEGGAPAAQADADVKADTPPKRKRKRKINPLLDPSSFANMAADGIIEQKRRSEAADIASMAVASECPSFAHAGATVLAKDCTDVWLSAVVKEIDESAGRLKVHFRGWSAEYDEWIGFTANRLKSKPMQPNSKRSTLAPRGDSLPGNKHSGGGGGGPAVAGLDRAEGGSRSVVPSRPLRGGDGSKRGSKPKSEFVVASIVRERLTDTHPPKKEYLVRWKGFGPASATWEPEQNVHDCAAFKAYQQKLQQQAGEGAAGGSGGGNNGSTSSTSSDSYDLQLAQIHDRWVRQCKAETGASGLNMHALSPTIVVINIKAQPAGKAPTQHLHQPSQYQQNHHHHHHQQQQHDRDNDYQNQRRGKRGRGRSRGRGRKVVGRKLCMAADCSNVSQKKRLCIRHARQAGFLPPRGGGGGGSAAESTINNAFDLRVYNAKLANFASFTFLVCALSPVVVTFRRIRRHVQAAKAALK